MNTAILEEMVNTLDLPDSAYETAKKRYEDISAWLERNESKSRIHSPHIFPQGSFRLGTAIRPMSNSEEYDLDIACKLRTGVTKASHTQKMLKVLLRYDLETYRRSMGISSPPKEKHRCWRLEYQDNLSFHIDIVPCIPEESSQRAFLKEAMINAGENNELSKQVADLAVSITDDRLDSYNQISEDWLISNPEGYARWFESRMRLAESYLIERAKMVKVAHIDELQYYQWKTPLQRSIQLLKRHRNKMFDDNPDLKPISIIITTLASKAYQGEMNIGLALETILKHMDAFVNDETPRIPNPVNPKEDFADRWSMPQYKTLELEHNFWLWLNAAKADFASLSRTDDASFIAKQASMKFNLTLNESDLKTVLGVTTAPNLYIPKEHQINDSSKPWRS